MPDRLISPTGKEMQLRPVRPSAAIRAAYQKGLLKLVDEMHDSIKYWLAAAYRQNEPEMLRLASDARTPAYFLRNAMKALRERWLKRFDTGSQRMAELFANKSAKYTDTAMAQVLRDAGISVSFQMTPAMRDALDASITENVNLIKSIAEQHLTQVETVIMQSVTRGRDLQALTAELEKRFAVTRRRAILIARDQSNKAQAVMTRARQMETGITHARWRHSHGGNKPRPSHVAAGAADVGKGLKYELSKGAYIDGAYILPGELINCRCASSPVLPGIDD
jgi:uncharacterized protein with gpF-like domain